MRKSDINRLVRMLPVNKKLTVVLILFVSAFFAAAQAGVLDRIIPAKELSLVDNLESKDVLLEFTPGRAEELIISLLNSAEDTIHLAAYSFTSKPIATALLKARDRGVRIFVIMDKSNKTSQYSSATFLANNKIPVRINERYAIMHNKFIVVDGKHIKTGSFNYSKAAAQRNAENVLVIYNTPKIAERYFYEWKRLWDESVDYR